MGNRDLTYKLAFFGTYLEEARNFPLNAKLFRVRS